MYQESTQALCLCYLIWSPPSSWGYENWDMKLSISLSCCWRCMGLNSGLPQLKLLASSTVNPVLLDSTEALKWVIILCNEQRQEGTTWGCWISAASSLGVTMAESVLKACISVTTSPPPCAFELPLTPSYNGTGGFLHCSLVTSSKYHLLGLNVC